MCCKDMTKDQTYLNKINHSICNFSRKSDCDFRWQLKWEFLKMGDPQIDYSLYERSSKGKTTKNNKFIQPTKKLENSLDDANTLGKYKSIKSELDTIDDHNA